MLWLCPPPPLHRVLHGIKANSLTSPAAQGHTAESWGKSPSRHLVGLAHLATRGQPVSPSSGGLGWDWGIHLLTGLPLQHRASVFSYGLAGLLSPGCLQPFDPFSSGGQTRGHRQRGT